MFNLNCLFRKVEERCAEGARKEEMGRLSLRREDYVKTLKRGAIKVGVDR